MGDIYIVFVVGMLIMSVSCLIVGYAVGRLNSHDLRS